MITIPLADIKAKICEQGKLSKDEVDKRIKKKLSDLSGLISEEGAAHIIANELGIKLIQQTTPGESIAIKNILAGMKNVEVAGKVTKKYELREFKTDKRSGKLASLMMTDTTGSMRVVLWNDQTKEFERMKEGDIIKLQAGYVRENNGRKEIHVSDSGKIIINPAGVSINVKESNQEDANPTRKSLAELAQGDDNIEVLATIVQVFDIRFFEIDPESGKRAQVKDGTYYVGDKQIPKIGYGYVMNLFLDDGTENVRTVLWKNQIQKLLGKSDEEIVKYKDAPQTFEPIKTELLGMIVKIVGRVNLNQAFNRLELVANMVFKDVDPEEEIRRLEKEKPTPKKIAAPDKEQPKIEKKVEVKAKEPEKKPIKIEEDEFEEETIDEDDESLSIDDLEKI